MRAANNVATAGGYGSFGDFEDCEYGRSPASARDRKSHGGAIVPTQQAEIARVSTAQVAWLCRVKPETASRKLREAHLEPVAKDGRTTWWDPRDAVPVVLGVGQGLVPSAEKARLDRASADLKELDLQIRRGELVPAGDTPVAMRALAKHIWSHVDRIPAAVASKLAREATPVGCQRIVAGAVRTALTALASDGRALGRRRGRGTR